MIRSMCWNMSCLVLTGSIEASSSFIISMSCFNKIANHWCNDLRISRDSIASTNNTIPVTYVYAFVSKEEWKELNLSAQNFIFSFSLLLIKETINIIQQMFKITQTMGGKRNGYNDIGFFSIINLLSDHFPSQISINVILRSIIHCHKDANKNSNTSLLNDDK